MIDINLHAVGEYLSKNKLWGKAFGNFAEAEIRQLCGVILEATADDEGVAPPYIDARGELIVPFKAPSHYRWWQGGQSITETLVELGAAAETIKQYSPERTGPGATPKERKP